MIKKKTRRKRIKLYQIVVLFLVVYISMIVMNQNKLKKELSLKEVEVLKDIEVLQEEIGELNREIEQRGTIQFLENTAREELGMVKPNEIIYIDKEKNKSPIFNFFNKHND